MANPELDNYEPLKAEAFLERNGYRRCDIPACNCGSYHEVREPTYGALRARNTRLEKFVGQLFGRYTGKDLEYLKTQPYGRAAGEFSIGDVIEAKELLES